MAAAVVLEVVAEVVVAVVAMTTLKMPTIQFNSSFIYMPTYQQKGQIQMVPVTEWYHTKRPLSDLLYSPSEF
jgi:hypothetical protein